MGNISLIIIVINVVITYQGLKSPGVFERYVFEVEKVLLYKDYKRLITSGFLHVGWASFDLQHAFPVFFQRRD